MGSLTSPPVRAAILSLLCIIGATAVGVISGPARPQAVSVVAATPLLVETPSPVATPSATPSATAPPLVTLSNPSLLAQELTTKKAHVPAGPSTVVPILMYHYIRVNPVASDRVGFNLSTPPKVFTAQMQYLADNGFHVISLHEAVVAIQQHRPLPSRPVVLTFDDGYADFFTAAVPVLRARGFTATDFVISGRMGVPGFLSAAQVAAADQQGFTIGAHTVDHYALATLAPARAAWEMRQGKLALESVLGHPVIDFAYPYGSFNSYAMGEARTLGFETAVSTLVGNVHTSAQLMYLSRLRVGGAMSLATFAHLVGGPVPRPSGTPASSPRPTPSPSPTTGVSPAPTRLRTR